MAFLDHAFDVNELPVSDNNYDPLPEGWYNCRIVEATIKQTKSGTGQYISIRYDVTGPSHQGCQVFGTLNIKNDSQKAEEIGRQQLGQLMRAIGLARVTDTDQLINGELQIKLSIKRDEQYGYKNEIKAFKAINASAAPMPQATVSGPAAQASAAPPWANK